MRHGSPGVLSAAAICASMLPLLENFSRPLATGHFFSRSIDQTLGLKMTTERAPQLLFDDGSRAIQQSAAPVTDSSFEKEVLESEVPVLVDFWAPWCGPCRMVAPVVDEIAEQYDGKVKVVKVNTDENPSVASTYGIRSIPTLALFRGGREVARQPGAMGAADIVRWVQSHS